MYSVALLRTWVKVSIPGMMTACSLGTTSCARFQVDLDLTIVDYRNGLDVKMESSVVSVPQLGVDSEYL